MLIGLSIVVLLLVGAVAALPGLLSTGPGTNLTESLASSGDTRVEFGDLDLSWSGVQRVEGLRVTDASGHQITDINAELRGSLLAWARGSRDFGTITVSGEVNVPPPDPNAPESPPRTEPIHVPEGLDATIEIADLDVSYDLGAAAPGPAGTSGGSQPVRLENVAGTIAIGAGEPVVFDLAGGTSVDGSQGRFSAAGQVENLIAADGTVDPLAARASGVTATAERLPVAFIDNLAQQDGLLVSLLGSAADLAATADGDRRNATADVRLTSPNAIADLGLAVADGRATVTRPNTVRLQVAPEVVSRLAGARAAEYGSLAGELDLALDVTRLNVPVPLDGQPLDLSGAQVEAVLAVPQARFDTGRADLPRVQLRDFQVSLASDDVTDAIALDMTGLLTPFATGGAPGATPRASLDAPIESHIVLNDAVTPQGAFAAETLGVTGNLRSRDLPTPAIDALAGLDGWLTDVAGPTLRTVEVTAGLEGRGDTPTTVFGIAVEAPNARVDGGGQLAEGTVRSIDGRPVRVEAALGEAVRERLESVLVPANIPVRLDDLGRLALQLDSFAIPLPEARDATSLEGDDSGPAWQRGNLAGTLTLEDQRLAVQRAAAEGQGAGGGTIPYAVERVALDFDATDLAQLVNVGLQARLSQGSQAFTLVGGAEVAAAFDPAQRVVQARVDETMLPTALVGVWAGEYADAVAEALGPRFNLALEATVEPVDRALTATVRSDRTDTQFAYREEGGRIGLEAEGAQTLTPGLIAAIRPPESAIALVEPARMSFALHTLPTSDNSPQAAPQRRAGADSGNNAFEEPPSRFAAVRLGFSAKSEGLTLTGLLGAAEPVTIANLDLASEMPQGTQGPGTHRLAGSVQRGNRPVTGLRAVATLAPGAPITEVRGNLALEGIDVPQVEALLGMPSGALAGWLGSRGSAEVGSVFDDAGRPTDDVRLAADFDRADANVTGRIAEDRLLLTSPGSIRANLDHQRFSAFLNETLAPGPSVGGSPAYFTDEAGRLVERLNERVGGDVISRPRREADEARRAREPAGVPGQDPWSLAQDVSVNATITGLSIPLAIVRGETYDPRLLSVQARVETSPIALRQGDAALNLTGTRLAVSGENLASGITGRLTGESALPGGEGGSLDLATTLRAATSDPADRRLDAQGQLQGFPVAFVDALANLNGKLVAALGSTMDLQLAMADVHADGGRIDQAVFLTPNGSLIVEETELRDRTLVTTGAPIRASLDVTQSMADSLLSNVSPLFFDVEKKAGPIELEAPRMAIPLDGDLSKLSGEFTLDIGQVQVPTEGLIGELLGSLDPTPAREAGATETEAPARVPPVTASIDGGVLTYDRLVIQSDLFEITTGGTVDLVNRQLDLTAAVPLIGWKSVFADLTNVAPGLIGEDESLQLPFYLEIAGPIDAPRVRPDPQGAQRVANEFFQNIGREATEDIVGDLFNELLGEDEVESGDRPQRNRPNRNRQNQSETQGDESKPSATQPATGGEQPKKNQGGGQKKNQQKKKKGRKGGESPATQPDDEPTTREDEEPATQPDDDGG